MTPQPYFIDHLRWIYCKALPVFLWRYMTNKREEWSVYGKQPGSVRGL